MERRKLGMTGLDTTVLGFGAMEVRGPRVWGGRAVSEQEASAILNAVLDAGINFIDTSYDYGRSEEFIGKCISHRRSEFYLATKCGCTLEDKGDHDDTPHVWTRENLMHNIETSLKRMKTDHVDLWQIHNANPDQVRDGNLVDVMEEVKRAGKVRHIGISSTLPHITTFIESGRFESFQIPYSALEREHEQSIGLAAKAGAGTIIRGGVAKGEPGQGLGGAQRWNIFEQAKLNELLAEGETKTGFLLRFTLSHPAMNTTIVGTMKPAHLHDNLRAAEAGILAASVYAEAKRRLDEAVKQAKKAAGAA